MKRDYHKAVAIRFFPKAVLVQGFGTPGLKAAHAALEQIDAEHGFPAGIEIGPMLLLFGEARIQILGLEVGSAHR